MNRKIKPLALALVAALALTAVMASAAQAQFTSSASSTTISGSQSETHKIVAGSGVGSITCESFTIVGSVSGTSSSTWTIDETFSGTCKDSLGRVVHVITDTIELHLLSGADKGKALLTGHFEWVVTGSTSCTIKWQGSQTLNGFSYTNNADGSVTLTTSTKNLTSTISGGFFACGTSATHSSTGTWTGSTLIKGTDTGGNAVAIKVD